MDADFPRRQFSERFYRRLASTFGPLVHHRDFFETFFTNVEGKARFLRQTLQHTCQGDPEFTFSDVVGALQSWLIQSGVLAKYGMNPAEHVSTEKGQPSKHVHSQLLEEIKDAYRQQKLRPVRGFFFVPGKRVDLGCPFVALALHRGVVDRADPELARNDAANIALGWAAEAFGENWTIGFMDGFDRQEMAGNYPSYVEGFDLGAALAQEILPSEGPFN